MKEPIKICELSVGDCAAVYHLQNAGTMRRRLQDLGLIENTVVECIGKSPGGGLGAYLIRGAVIAVRDEDGNHILVTPLEKDG
ncbi:MAG: ferrous iron transport protein A [Clostridia bacterium]|nr:ferrous iron transport protein A [Clostridia bacterium]